MDAIGVAMRGDNPQHGLVIQALSQTQGRGSGDSVWASPAGNLYFSMLIKRHGMHHQIIAFLAVTAVMAAIEENLTEANPCLKLPNDIMLDGEKVCGILTRANLCHEDWCNIGIGINVHTTPQIQDQNNVPTSLAEHGWPKDRPAQAFLASVLKHFDAAYQAQQNDPLHVFRVLGVVDVEGNMTAKNTEGDDVTGQFQNVVMRDDIDRFHLKNADGDHYVPIKTVCLRLTDGSWTLRR
jgi:biotin-[acetyl-CoA-carboxylase] ligase BirA-like protein